MGCESPQPLSASSGEIRIASEYKVLVLEVDTLHWKMAAAVQSADHQAIECSVFIQG